MRLPKKRIKEVYIPNDEDNGVVVIRNLSMEEEAKIEANYLSISETGVSFSNYAARTQEYAEACLEGWSNLKDENGEDLEFNKENLELASAFVILNTDKEGNETRTRFYEWVNEEREKFSKEVIEEEKRAKGNS